MAAAVLIVEDELPLRRTLRVNLEAAGHTVGDAASGEEALASLDEQEWDAVLLDQRLPGIDGLETLRRIRQDHPGVRVIILTGYASIDLAVDAMKLGAADFIRKPASAETIRAAVAAATRSEGRPEGHERLPQFTPTLRITHLTMNGFEVLDTPYVPDADPQCRRHRFRVARYPHGDRHVVDVRIDEEAVNRVARLSRRNLSPQGAFWRTQAENFLAGYLWKEGRIPKDGQLTLTDVSRDVIDLACAWEGD